MTVVSARVRSVWRDAVSLGWPIALQQTLNTLMRTVDVLITGFFSPAAVAAIGLADLYSRVPLRVGMGLGSGAIAISSQETGRASSATRDRAIAQALLVGALAGLPIAVVGVLGSEFLIDALGAERGVVLLGGQYLAVVLAAAPFRITGFVGARALQGIGDTRTPMLVNGAATGLNILLSVALGLGVGPAPRLGIVGVGIATAASRVVEATLLIGAIRSPRTAVSLARPRDIVVTRQLLAVSTPDVAGGLSTEVANFPFNALLLLFGTEATAAYHIANRLYQQLTAPLFRAFRTVSSIRVGQALGAGDRDEARYVAGAVCALSLLTLGAAGTGLFVGAEPLVGLFTDDAATIDDAVAFTRAFAVAMACIGVYFPLAGALKGAGDTRTPFYGGLVGAYGFLLGSSYVLAVTLGFGIVGVCVGIVLSWAARAAIVGAGVLRGDWAGLAAQLIEERAALDESE
ncbi:MATE family efflux transporter [Halarchaeum nitratireducens]|uniref:MATE family efflux transporter n=1 Tax=Halarchaeum nitratireducens TaxID=489913 RepID=UPI00166488CF|nr:MATE family efflux transporter [Halarchaeum nitratireducens]